MNTAVAGKGRHAPADPTTGEVADRRRSPWLSLRLPWLVLLACLGAFAYGVRTIPSAPASQFGLLAAASPLYALSILLAAGAFAIAIRQRNASAAVAATVAMIVCQRLPRVVSTEVPMYAWTYKHLGVVDYIQANHALAHGVDVYNGWPGLFAVTAWFSDLTGVPPIDVAHWFTLFFHLAMAGLVYAAARAWRLGTDQGLVAAFIVVTLNWVEQDYFAPQAVAMLLTVALFTLAGLSRERPVAVPLILVLFAAITISHQLTPYWIFLAVGLLVAGRKFRPWWILLPMAAMLLALFFYNFETTREYANFSLDVVGNASTNIPGPGAVGQLLTSTVMRTLSVAMWCGAALVLVIRWRRGQPVWALGVLALSPVLILGGQGYGGEAVFRVFLYSLPGCALLFAPILLAGLRAATARAAGAVAVLLLVTAASAQAYFGNWSTNLLTAAQVRAADDLLTQGDYPAYITPLSPVWPERSAGQYVRYAEYDERYDHSLIFQPELLGRHFADDADFDAFMTLIDARTDATTYLVLTEPMADYGAYFGLFPYDAVTNLRERLRDDPRWQTVEDERDLGVYVHRPPTR
ncbi:hypothetical protein ACN27E_25045 [Mycobacterium sp. WMMD1722]|uniref:hypothetical protein n=1 Tax=Mycobacterium sp. WMMD1722 TaxID=3404117 RepID=UPI003BF60CA6